MPEIHPTAVIGPSVQLADSCRIGPFCVLDGEVELADGVVLESHVVVQGHTSIGPNTQIFPFASIGHRPQDLKYNNDSKANGDTLIELGSTGPALRLLRHHRHATANVSLQHFGP